VELCCHRGWMLIIMNTDNNIFRVAAVLYASNNYDISLKQVYRKIIEDALSLLDREIEIGELAEFIQNHYSLLFSETEIKETLTDSKFSNIFAIIPQPSGNKYKLTEKRKLILKTKTPSKTLIDYVEQYISERELPSEKGACILRFMYGMYTSNVDSFQKLLQTKRIENVVENEKFNAEEADIINGFLDWDDEGKNVTIFNVANYALEYCLITSKRESSIKLSSLRKKIFYLDTNILYRAIGINGEDRKKRTHQFLAKLKSLDNDIIITGKTNQEFLQSIKSYMKKLRKAESPAISSKVFTEYVTFDDIWRYYHVMAACRINFTVDLFNAYLQSEYQILLDTYEITVEDDRSLSVPNEELNNLASQIKGVSDTKTFDTALFDANNIEWIENKRQGNEWTIFDAKHFLLSSDNGLRYWDSRYHSQYVPIVILPSQWMSIILRYIERTSDDFKSFVCFLNIKNVETKLTDEQIHAVLAGIAEMTTNVDQQRNLLETIINEDFKKDAKSMSTEQIRFISKKSAERRLQQQILKEKEKTQALALALDEATKKAKDANQEKATIELQHKDEIAHKNRLVRETEQREVKLKEENGNLKSSLSEKEERIAILENKINRDSFRKKKIWNIIWKSILLTFLIIHFIWYLMVNDKDENYMGKFYRFVLSLAATKTPLISGIIIALFSGFVLPLIKSLWNNIWSSYKSPEVSNR